MRRIFCWMGFGERSATPRATRLLGKVVSRAAKEQEEEQQEEPVVRRMVGSWHVCSFTVQLQSHSPC